MNVMRKLISSNRGSVAVEFALFTPVLLAILFGIIELGSGWYNKQLLVNASREGARRGILPVSEGITPSDVENHVRTVLTQAGYPGTVSVTSSGVGGGPGTLVRVQIDSQYQMPVLGSLIPGSLSTVTLQAVTVMRHE